MEFFATTGDGALKDAVLYIVVGTNVGRSEARAITQLQNRQATILRVIVLSTQMLWVNFYSTAK